MCVLSAMVGIWLNKMDKREVARASGEGNPPSAIRN
jgi:hypothetical protein